MYVIKRNGERKEVSFNEVLNRISDLSYDLDTKYIDPAVIAQETIDGIYDGIKTTELDELASQICASKATEHPDFSLLAARIAVSNIHKETEPSFTKVVERLHSYVEPKTGLHAPLVSDRLLELVKKYGDIIDSAIDFSNDLNFYDYFAIATLKKGYLISIDNQVIERPQHMLMRVALGIHDDDIDAAIETYKLMSQKYFTHASPTLFNAGTQKPQLSSCFLLSMVEDSIEGIYDTLKRCAKISQTGGGIGVSIQNIRAKGTYIAGSRGVSDGIVPMLKNFNETARYVNQGGKRLGAFAMYLEPWHLDIYDFLDLKKNHGAEELRARELFYAIWMNDIFMRRVEEDGKWSLMCPKECPGLLESYGKEFEKNYLKYESEGRARKTIKARDLWFKILETQIETGTPYILYKDTANKKSNQKNLGTIRSSNLCAEIIEYTSPTEVAVCNLASIALSRFVENEKFNYQKLHKVTKVAIANLNKVIDVNYYPIKEAKESNLKHRPVGLGVQGLADVFALMKLTFDETEARVVNKKIFETMYHAAIETSVELAKSQGAYETFKGSPASEGLFQFDLWNVTPDSGMYDWEELRERMKKYGLRNSLLIALMPTATTGQILGNNESIEPFTSNLYVRRVLSGEFIVINKHLLQEIINLGIWDKDLKHELIANKGSLQNIERIPAEIRERYRTVREIPQRSVIDMAVDRGAFICQSQSMNIFMTGATVQKLTAMHFYAWRRGLKTGMYYLRNTPARDAVQFTVDKTKLNNQQQTQTKQEQEVKVTNIGYNDDEPNLCISCGS